MVLVDPGVPTLGAEQPIGQKPLPMGPPAELSRRPDNIAMEIRRRWDQGAQDLSGARRSYWVNLAFYLGQQWTWWSNERNMLMPYPRQIAPLGVGKVRLTVNRFGPNLLNAWNRLLRSELVFEVPPSDGADPMIQGAKRAERVLEAKRVDDNWEAVRADALLAALLGGTSAIAVEWDSTLGKELPFVNEQSGRVVGTGDAIIRSRNINEFVMQPNVRRYEDALWWIDGVALPISYVQEHYDLNWLPRPDASTSRTPLYDTLLDGSGRNRGRNLCLVLTYYERPNRKNPKGLHAVVVNGIAIHNGDWPFEFPELNLTVFRQKRVDGRAIGATFCDDAIPIQMAYNLSRSIVQEHMKLAGNARLIAPFGSLEEEDLHGTAGEILYWSPDGSGATPQYMAPPNLPRWISQEPENLAAELDNCMHVHAISQGIGFSRASGQALAFLAEQDDSALGHMVIEQKLGWSRVATQVLKLYGAKAQETRVARITLAKGITDTLSWSGRELQGQYDVHVPLEAVTPRNAAARLQNAKDLWDRKIITDPRRYARMVGLPADEFGQLLDPDADLANRENLRMAMGEVVLPNDFDDHAVHIAEHNDRLRKTDAYLYAGPEVRSIVDDHIKWHENKAANEFARQTALARVSPGAAATPQASAPVGSDVPQGEAEQMGRLGALSSLGINPQQMSQGAAAGGSAMPVTGPSVTDATAAGGP